MEIKKEKLVQSGEFLTFQVCDDLFDMKSLHDLTLEPGVTAVMGDCQDGLTWCKEIRFAKEHDAEKAVTWLEKNIDNVTHHLYSVPDVEIFSVGTWNGHEITVEDLADMVACFKATGSACKPYLKLGHNDDQDLVKSAGLPAAGWVGDLRVVGNKLVADFVDIPKKIYALIKSKAYGSVSSEVFNNITIAGQKYRKMLSAVALLGAETPAVMDLKGILSLYSARPFTTDSKPDIIEINKSEFNAKKDVKMDEQFAIEKARADKLQLTVDELQAANAKRERELFSLKTSQFIDGLEKQNLVTPAMKPFIAALFENKETYSIEKKEFSKEDLVKEILSLGNEAAKLNFAQKTKTGETKTEGMSEDDMMMAKVKKYAAENKMDFTEAYRCTDGGKKL